MKKREIIIAGAGLSGLTAAINLALEGRPVIVFDKGREVGGRFVNDFQGLDNYSTSQDVIDWLAEMNLPTDFACTAFTELETIDCGGERRLITSYRPGVYLVKRGTDSDSLDQAFKRRALKLGVEIRLGQAIERERADIIAWGPKSSAMIVGGVNFCTNAQDRLVLVVSNELAPGGYAYLAVAQGRGTLGAVLFENFSLANQCRDKSIKALQELYQFSMEEAQPFSGRGDFFLEQSFTKEGRLLVGEAAGLQDYWFGFGMRYAIRSGYLASQSILEGVDFGKLLHQDGLIENARASLAVRFLFEVRGDSCQWLWRKWSDPGRVLGNMRSYYRLTLPRLLLYHLARFLWRKKRALSRTDNDLWAKPE